MRSLSCSRLPAPAENLLAEQLEANPAYRFEPQFQWTAAGPHAAAAAADAARAPLPTATAAQTSAAASFFPTFKTVKSTAKLQRHVTLVDPTSSTVFPPMADDVFGAPVADHALDVSGLPIEPQPDEDGENGPATGGEDERIADDVGSSRDDAAAARHEYNIDRFGFLAPPPNAHPRAERAAAADEDALDSDRAPDMANSPKKKKKVRPLSAVITSDARLPPGVADAVAAAGQPSGAPAESAPPPRGPTPTRVVFPPPPYETRGFFAFWALCSVSRVWVLCPAHSAML